MSCQSTKDNSEFAELDKITSTMKAHQQKENQLDTLLNTDNYLILGDKHSKVKVVAENKINDYPTYE